MADYYNVTTNTGDAEIAAAIASNTKLAITHIAFGDGNGAVPTPNKARTSLVREVHRQPVTKYERHPTNSNWIVIETIIPSNIGGFWVREMGVIANGKLISHGSHAPFEKVTDPTGVSEYRIKFTQNIKDGNVVNITLDESLIYASQAWVNENYVPRADIVNNLTTADATKPLSAAQGRELGQKKVDKTSIRKTFGNTYAPLAGAGYDFNNILPGDYVFKDASITTLNAPPFEYASVYCEGTLTYDDQRFVIAREYFSGKLAVRGRQNGIWSGWSVLAFNSDNVASATKLQTARTIGGVAFDGTANINLPGVNTAGNQNTSGNAATATKLQTARTISIAGDGSGNANFDGSVNAGINLTLNNVNNSDGTWGANNLEIPTFTLNKKGLLTSATNRQFPIASTTQYGATVLYAGLDLNSNEHAATAATVKYLSDNKVDKTSIRKTFGNTYAPLAGAGYDFNNIMPGDYVFNEASITTLNAPPFEYASVYCEGTLTYDDQRFVIAREYFSGKLAVRGRQNGIWSGWSVLAFNSDNVASATKLQTARTIGGVSFDGTDNINLPGVNTVGNQNTSGNAATASKLQTPRNIAISGDVSGSAYFDGSGNIQINTSVNGFDNWKGQNGYTKLPNGLILQWGTQDYASNPGEVSASITFPIAFPNSCLNISLTRKISAQSPDGDGTALLISTTQTMAHISLQHMNQTATSGLRGYTWLAIGY